VTSSRLTGVDVARGVALLGMASVHVFPSGSDDGGTHPAHLLAAGRSAALFALLAGVGIALYTGGQVPLRGLARARRSAALAVRAVLVGLVGLLLALLDTGVAVILAYYAVLFVVALPLLGLRTRRLAVLAVTVALVAPFLSLALRDDLPLDPGPSPTPRTLLEEPGGLLQTLVLTGYYPVLGWTAYLCAGLAVGRLALGSPRVAGLLLAGGAVLAAAASAASALLLGPLGGYERIAAASDLSRQAVEDVAGQGLAGNVPTTTAWWLATDAAHSTTPPDLLHTTGTALLVLGAALLVARHARRLLAPLAAAGSMPLTMYSSHLVVLALVDDPEPLPFWLAQAAAGLALAWVWRHYLGRGPLERLVGLATRPLAGGPARPAAQDTAPAAPDGGADPGTGRGTGPLAGGGPRPATGSGTRT
jgi:uncharacterized membrane protein